MKGGLRRLAVEGEHLISLGYDNCLNVWNLKEKKFGKKIGKISENSPNNLKEINPPILMSSSAGGKLNLIDIKTEKVVKVIRTDFAEGFPSAVLTRDSVFIGLSNGELHVFSIETGEKVTQFDGKSGSHTQEIRTIFVCGDSVFTGGLDKSVRMFSRDKSTKVWHTKCKSVFRGDKINKFTLLPQVFFSQISTSK